MINKIPVMLRIPKFLFAKPKEVSKQNEVRNGNASDAKIIAKVGSGLKSKYFVLEKGSDRDETNPEPASQTGSTPSALR